MPKLEEALALEPLRCAAMNRPFPPQQGINKTVAQKPQFGFQQQNKPGFQNFGPNQPQKPGFGQAMNRQNMGNNPAMDGPPDHGQVSDELGLAFARLQRLVKFSQPGQDKLLKAAEMIIRMAHAANVTGNHEGASRHVAHAHMLMNRVRPKTLGLPKPTTHAKLKKRDQGREFRQQVSQIDQQKKIEQRFAPDKGAPSGSSNGKTAGTAKAKQSR